MNLDATLAEARGYLSDPSFNNASVVPVGRPFTIGYTDTIGFRAERVKGFPIGLDGVTTTVACNPDADHAGLYWITIQQTSGSILYSWFDNGTWSHFLACAWDEPRAVAAAARQPHRRRAWAVQHQMTGGPVQVSFDVLLTLTETRTAKVAEYAATLAAWLIGQVEQPVPTIRRLDALSANSQRVELERLGFRTSGLPESDLFQVVTGAKLILAA